MSQLDRLRTEAAALNAAAVARVLQQCGPIAPSELSLALSDVLLRYGNGRKPIDAQIAGAEAWQPEPPGLIEVVELLVDHGVDVNEGVWLSGTPLQAAVNRGFTKVCSLLLAHKANPNARNASLFGRTPMHFAAGRPSAVPDHIITVIVKMLIEHGADLDLEDEHLQTPRELLNAWAPGLLGGVGGEVDTEEPDAICDTDPRQMIKAIRDGDHDALSKMLAAGADVEYRDSKNQSLLGFAVGRQSVEAVRILLHHGATVDDLTVAAALEQPIPHTEASNHIVALLLDNSKKADQDLGYGKRPLHYLVNQAHAGSSAQVALIQTLIDGYAVDVNATDDKGQTPLSILCREIPTQQQLAIARLLLDGKADPNSANRDGDTPLHAAADAGWVEMVELLLDFGADPSAKESRGWTASDYAHVGGHAGVERALKRRCSLWRRWFPRRGTSKATR